MDDFLTQEEYRKLRDEFVRVFRRIWPNYFSVEDLEDIFQEAMLIYYNSCVKAGKRLFLGPEEKKWIFAIARNLLLKLYKRLKAQEAKKKRKPGDNSSVETLIRFWGVEDEQLLEKLRKLLQELSPVDRDIYVAVKVYKISYKELAKEYDRSERGLRVLVNRINNKLRKGLGGTN